MPTQISFHLIMITFSKVSHFEVHGLLFIRYSRKILESTLTAKTCVYVCVKTGGLKYICKAIHYPHVCMVTQL